MPTKPAAQTKYTVQNMENKSYDEDFDVLTREMLTYNPVSGGLERETEVGQGNASYVFTWTSGNLTGIAKTVGVTTYNRTLSYTDGELTGITIWT